MTILVTGGAGYIGSHTVRALQRKGRRVVVLDNLLYGHRHIVEQELQVPLVEGQLGDRALLDQLLSGDQPSSAEPIEAVLHFAAYAYVEESVADPARYYRNNLGDSLTLLEALLAEGQRRGGPPLPADDPLQRQPLIDLAQRELSWQPKVPLEQGLEPTTAWFRSSLES
jgi:UDP-glucose 4-epimerase